MPLKEMEHAYFTHILIALALLLVTSKTGSTTTVSNKYDVRLEGPNPYEGMVQVRRRGDETWGSVCYNIWSRRETEVVCRHLGLGHGRVIQYERRNVTKFFDDLTCRGYETSLDACSLGNLYTDTRDWNCKFTFVHCQPPGCSSVEDPGEFCSPSQNTDLDVRLVRGPNKKEGRVEVRRGDSGWGTVCDDGFNKKAATVVCRQLKLGVEGIPTSNPDASTTPKRMFLDDLDCNGTESNLGHCGHVGWGNHDCGDSEVVGVRCLGEVITTLATPKETPTRTEDTIQISTETPKMPVSDCSNSKVNIAFLFDSSTNISRRDFSITENFMLGVLNSFQHNANKVHTSVIFSFENIFRSLPDNRPLFEVIQEMGSRHGNASATNFLLRMTRSYVPNVIWYIVEDISTTFSHQHYHQILEQLTEAADLHIFTAGIGLVNTTVFDSMGVVVKRRFNVRYFGDLPNLVQRVTGAICEAIAERQTTQPTSTAPITLHTNSATVNEALTTAEDTQWTATEQATVSGIETTTPLAESNKTSILRNLTRSGVTAEAVHRFRQVMEEPGDTSAADVEEAAHFLHQASQLTNISRQTAKGLLEIVDTLSELNQSVLQQSNSVGNTTNRLILAVEQLADQLDLEEGEVRLETNTTVLHVWNLTRAPHASFLGLQLNTDGQTQNAGSVGDRSEADMFASVDTAILLPGDIGRQIVELSDHSGQAIRLSATVFKQTGLFQAVGPTDTYDTSSDQGTDQGTTGTDQGTTGTDQGTTGTDQGTTGTDQGTTGTDQGTTGTDQGSEDGPAGRFDLNSKVISLRITVNGQPVTNLSAFGQGKVTTVFTPLKPPYPSLASQQRERIQCVFWDFALRQGRGGWSRDGCYLHNVDSDRVVCRCDHLTNFAVLMDFRSQDVKRESIHENLLNLISTVGLSFSICGLSLTILAFILVKKLHTSLPQQTLFNMALALLLSWLIFLAGIDSVDDHATCVAVAMLLHYFILASFLWMLAQGVLQYFMLVKARSRPFTRYMLKAGLPAWGLPVLPVMIVSAVDVELYRGGKKHCWMSMTAFYYAFLAPIAVIVTINLVIYLMVVISICRRPNLSTGGTSYTVISFRASVSSFVVLGLSWTFAFFALEDARVVFQYLFTCTTALQGFLIFVLYTARDPNVRAFFLNKIRKADTSSTPERELPLSSRRLVKTASTKETSFTRSK